MAPKHKLRLLVTGGSSYLGRHLLPLVPAHWLLAYTYFHNSTAAQPGGQAVDICDATAVYQLVQQFQPDVIIHTVGSNRSPNMTAVISQGTRHICQAATAVGARLIHLSTDSVFSGHAAPYHETAVPDPVNAYGRAKAAAEEIVQQHPNTVIIRTSLIYGLQQIDHGTAWMAQALKAGEPVQLFSNQIRNPVWVETLSHACLELAQNSYVGILNVAGQQAMSRAEFSLRLLDYWQIEPRHTLFIAPSEGGHWPLDCRLDLARATAVLQTPLLGVDQCLPPK